MKYRKLRIAWSVAWGVVAVLLVALWVRSYSWFDNANLSASRTVVLNSLDGGVGLVYSDAASASGLTSILVDEIKPQLDRGMRKRRSWLFSVAPAGMWVRCPHWFAVLLVGLVALVPWVHLFHRFSLRTLLIAMTLVTVVLGIIVWMSRV